MKVFTEEDSKVKRGVIVLGGLAAAASLVVLALAVLLGSDEQPRPSVFKKRKAPAELAVQEASLVPIVEWRRMEEAPAANVGEVARAMDLSNVRSLIRTLMEAAAMENRPLKESMVSAVGRYRKTAHPILNEEIARAGSVAVRKALEEALREAQ